VKLGAFPFVEKILSFEGKSPPLKLTFEGKNYKASTERDLF
jgi:hypothetical protein